MMQHIPKKSYLDHSLKLMEIKIENYDYIKSNKSINSKDDISYNYPNE